MPLNSDIQICDNLVVNLSESDENQTFTVALANKRSVVLKVKRVYTSLDCVKVINFNEKNAIIPANQGFSFIFEVQSKAASEIESFKIRFSFKNSGHITRSVQIAKWNQNIENKLNFDKSITKESKCIKQPIELDDNLVIEFDQSQRNKVCKVIARSFTSKKFRLNFINIVKPIVKLCAPVGNGKRLSVPPKGELKLLFEATFVPNKINDTTKIYFAFDSMTIWRTLKIVYQTKGPAIQKDEYDTPNELVALIEIETTKLRPKVVNALDEWVPSVDENYAKHFHNLYYLEEIGMRKEIKTTYNQKEAYFGDIETMYEDGKIIRRKYEHGIYDLEIKHLYEVRPSLKIGDKIIARKHSALTVCYEGRMIKIKESDLVCVQFGDDFVQTFDNTAYVIEFDFSRSMWIRMHFALDLAVDIFGIEYLIPKELLKRNATLVDVHLNEHEQLEMTNRKVINWFVDGLNVYQKQAVVNTLRADLLNPYLIYGPPGTGKTTTLTEIILQILTNIKHSYILITTQSNSAANLIVQRLIKFDQVNSSNLLRLLAFNYAQKSSGLPDDIKQYSSTVEDLIPGSKSITDRLISIMRFRIVVGTSTAIAQLLEAKTIRNHFTHAIIDEAGQSTELGILVPMSLVRTNGQTIMAGDPMQMPPLVINFHAITRGLNISTLSRLMECYSNIESLVDENQKFDVSRLVSKLFFNYRSIPSILEFYNTQFYESKLIPMIDSKKSHEAKLLNHLSVVFDHSTDYGIHFVNVDGRNERVKNSFRNLNEAHVIKYLADEIMKLGLNECDMGIITPYSMQARIIEFVLKEHPHIKVGTVEEFQGLERKVVLLSTVRTCPTIVQRDISRYLGFVKCPNRVNVAMSRARAMVIVVGKGDLLATDENWQVLIEKCKLNKTYRHASV